MSMTIIEAINQIDTLKPNNYSQAEKIKWLSNLDGMIKAEIINGYEGGEDIPFIPYDENTPLDTQLLVPHPYDDVYIKWLEAQIDYANNETVRYSNSISMYNNAISGFSNYYNRTHKHLNTKLKFF